MSSVTQLLSRDVTFERRTVGHRLSEFEGWGGGGGMGRRGAGLSIGVWGSYIVHLHKVVYCSRDGLWKKGRVVSSALMCDIAGSPMPVPLAHELRTLLHHRDMLCLQGEHCAGVSKRVIHREAGGRNSGSHALERICEMR